jgi:hypothetical protein
MSKRQPTVTIDDQTIAHDEIVEFVNLNESVRRGEKNQKPVLNAVKLVSGKILPLPAHKISGVIAFFYQNDQ